MPILLLCILHVAFSLLACATVVRFAAACENKLLANTLRVAATVPLLAFHGLLAWKACVLRFQLGIEHARWLEALGVMLAHAAGVVWILRNRRRDFGSTMTFALATLIALALEAGLIWNLQLRLQLQLLEARVEAGRIAYELTAQPAVTESNAGPVYERLAVELFGGTERVDLEPWLSALNGKADLDTQDPRLLALLARCAPAFEELREASLLPTCRFEPRDTETVEVVSAPDILPLFSVARVLQLDARVRTANGDLHGAIEDLRSSYRLARQLARTRLTIVVMVAGAIATDSHATLMRALAAPGVNADDVRDLESLFTEFAPLGPDMIDLEKAYGLGMLGSLAGNGLDAIGQGGVIETAYVLSAGAEELAGYRALMTDQHALASGPLDRLLRAANDPEYIAEVRSRGLLALYVAPNLPRTLVQLHRIDLTNLLARAALASARIRIEHGQSPNSASDLGAGFEGVRLTREGDALRFELVDPMGLENPPTLRLPPTTKH